MYGSLHEFCAYGICGLVEPGWANAGSKPCYVLCLVAHKALGSMTAKTDAHHFIASLCSPDATSCCLVTCKTCGVLTSSSNGEVTSTRSHRHINSEEHTLNHFNTHRLNHCHRHKYTHNHINKHMHNDTVIGIIVAHRQPQSHRQNRLGPID